MASEEPASTDAQPEPKKAVTMETLFKKKKKGTGAGTKKEAAKKKGGEWDEDVDEVDEVKGPAVQVASLVEEVEEAKEEGKGPIWNKGKDEDGDKKVAAPVAFSRTQGAAAFPSLSTKTAAKSSTAKASSKPSQGVGAIKSHANAFCELEGEDEDEEKPAAKERSTEERTAEEDAAAEKKRLKKEQKRLEKEARDKAAAAEQEKENAKASLQVVMINGVKDTEIKADLLRVEEKFKGRRKKEPQPLDEDDE